MGVAPKPRPRRRRSPRTCSGSLAPGDRQRGRTDTRAGTGSLGLPLAVDAPGACPSFLALDEGVLIQPPHLVEEVEDVPQSDVYFLAFAEPTKDFAACGLSTSRDARVKEVVANVPEVAKNVLAGADSTRHFTIVMRQLGAVSAIPQVPDLSQPSLECDVLHWAARCSPQVQGLSSQLEERAKARVPRPREAVARGPHGIIQRLESAACCWRAPASAAAVRPRALSGFHQVDAATSRSWR